MNPHPVRHHGEPGNDERAITRRRASRGAWGVSTGVMSAPGMPCLLPAASGPAGSRVRGLTGGDRPAEARLST